MIARFSSEALGFSCVRSGLWFSAVPMLAQSYRLQLNAPQLDTPNPVGPSNSACRFEGQNYAIWGLADGLLLRLSFALSKPIDSPKDLQPLERIKSCLGCRDLGDKYR